MKTYLIRLHLIIFGRIFVFLRGLTGDGERSAAAEIWELAYRACRVAGEEECSTGAKNLNVIRHSSFCPSWGLVVYPPQLLLCV